MNIVSQNGAPGAEVNITVRGGTSITQSTTPIYIIDGFQSEDGLKNIDVNDIKTIDILKRCFDNSYLWSAWIKWCGSYYDQKWK